MGNEDFKLPPGWHCRSLVDCTKGRNISYGIVQPGQHQDDGIGIIRVNNIQNGKISVADVLKVSHDVEIKFSKTRLEGGEVLLTLVGSTGLSAITTKDLHGWNVARAVAVIKPSDEISAEWIHICLQSPYTKYFLDSRANTTVQKTLNLKDVKEIPLPIPPIQERMNLEKFYFDLENKINLNFEINQTLEQISQALFKSWFVDFDPVIDNALDAGNTIPEALQSRAELRQKVRNSTDFKPLPANIRALFPAEFEDTELGWVPKGWLLESVAKSININPSVKLPKNTIAKYVDMRSLPTQGYSISDIIEKPYSGGAKFQKNDTLFARITPCLENGKTGFVDFLDENETAFGSTEFIVMRGTTKVHYTYVACLARENHFRLHAIQNMVGSSGRQRVQNSCFDSFFITIPTPSVMRLFAGKVSSFFDKMHYCNVENKSLTNLRDTLLPKLISGELSLEDLPDIIKQTEAA
ncbi:restriction endonuclease subunit S [Leclercia sp. LSNIH6]|nr:restriction endonuclease subunit S [Leclercia sp. LSNIH7]POU77776.1 restriction endonuclease subunit S [Leclercia sp. LSNIH6]POW50354.1 restriction endonuclease subunit S [Leclercia sp. LSNIH8]